MKRYTFDTDSGTIVTVECAKRGHPHRDELGNTQYDNTHFDTPDEAWEKLIREAKAGLSINTSSVSNLRENLAKAEKRLADSAIKLQTAEENFRQFKRFVEADEEATK